MRAYAYLFADVLMGVLLSASPNCFVMNPLSRLDYNYCTAVNVCLFWTAPSLAHPVYCMFWSLIFLEPPLFSRPDPSFDSLF